MILPTLMPNGLSSSQCSRKDPGSGTDRDCSQHSTPRAVSSLNPPHSRAGTITALALYMRELRPSAASTLSKVTQLGEGQSQNLNLDGSRVSALAPVTVALWRSLGHRCCVDRVLACHGLLSPKSGRAPSP